MFLSNNRYIKVKTAFMCGEGELILLCEIEFCVVFCVVRAVHIFVYALRINWIRNKVESGRELRF